MSQVVENFALVEGVVEAVEPGVVSEHAAVRLRVHRISDLAGYRNLIKEAPGNPLTVQLRIEDEKTPQPGEVVMWRVRLAGPGRYFALRNT